MGKIIKIILKRFLFIYFLVNTLTQAKPRRKFKHTHPTIKMNANKKPLQKYKSIVLPINIKKIACHNLADFQLALSEIKDSMNDWAQVNYYSQANQDVIKMNEKEKVVFLGDSITELWSNPNNSDLFNKKNYINRGISAQTTSQMLLRMKTDVIELKPELLVLLAGTNDIAGNTGPISLAQIKNNIKIISELASLHKIKVVLCSILPTSNYHCKTKNIYGSQTLKRPLEKIKKLNDWIKQYCEINGHYYLDYFIHMIDINGMLKFEYSEDDLHPNKLGYAKMTMLVNKAIDKVLAHL